MAETVTYTHRLDLKQSQSPLADLVRRTSSRRAKGRQPHWQKNEHIDSPPSDGRNQQKMLYLDIERSLSSTISAPHSPLLHTLFARDSIATASSFDDNSYLDTDMPSVRSSDYDYRYFEDDAEDRNPSWGATDKPEVAFHNSKTFVDIRHLSNNSCPSPSQQEQDPRQVKGAPASVPSVFISLHDPPTNNSVVDSATVRDGPIVKPVTNFSRPIRESGQPEHAGAMGERVMPQLPPDMREQKLKVLERNARRGVGRSSTENVKVQSPLSQTMYVDSLFVQNGSNLGQNHGSVQSPAEGQQGRSSPLIRNLYPQPHPIPPNANLHPQSRSSETGIRTISPVSLYSTTYSYYDYESAVPSPSGNRPLTRPPSRAAEVEQPQRSPSSTSSNGFAPRSPEGLRTPQEYLQLGIQHHEANRLRESARCFERSATEEGGCGVGMLMYGLTLRHGWGCAKNEKAGFKWLRKAAEHAVEDLEKVRMNGDVDVKVIETELVLAIYEVGQCFFQGWGVAKDQKMAVSYYTVAARLGDGDAQVDLGFCLANGKGCKKDKKSAAKWYRAAVSQGQSDVGLAWIYKQKYT